MEPAYVTTSNYTDVWRSSPSRHSVSPESPRSFTELNMNTLSMPSFEFDQFPNVFSFSPCPPGYKDLTVFKEKAPHDIADALLSLKHAVVHPQFSGQLSPLSPPPPMSHLGHSQMMNPGPLTHQNHQGLGYPVSHQGPVFHNSYPAPPPSQYASQYPDPGPSTSGQPTPQANVHFPSMSVNVSMSMNVGMPPGLGNTQYSPVPPQQWPPQPQSPTLGQYHPGHPHPQSLQPQYGGYNAQPYPPAYSFTSDFRPMADGRGGIYYKHAESFKDATRFCTMGHLKRSKFLPDKTPPPPPGMDPNSLKTNMCRICGKTYARPSTLKTHLRTHSGEKPYKCTTCNKSFSQAANLTAHIRTHSGEKPFRCPICDRRFSQSSSVTTHMRTHSGERPYRCRLCKKAFSDSSTLTKHLRIHSGEKPYQCKLCLLRFSQSGNLNRHMRVHTNTG
ncbi:protein glass-like [Haliotis rubra]|uniref:protein glass-like n=1 Tax=Haliotis rubra TaxID=36100 RepID=UPI001EE63310|nr:protein glass-like [Haliotis rubra]